VAGESHARLTARPSPTLSLSHLGRRTSPHLAIAPWIALIHLSPLLAQLIPSHSDVKNVLRSVSPSHGRLLGARPRPQPPALRSLTPQT
jgi:hypothetical protein